MAEWRSLGDPGKSEYTTWRKSLEPLLEKGCQDVDQVEYVVRRGRIVPVAVVEETSPSSGYFYTDDARENYLELIKQSKPHACQKRVSTVIADMLGGVPVFYLQYERGFYKDPPGDEQSKGRMWVRFWNANEFPGLTGPGGPCENWQEDVFTLIDRRKWFNLLRHLRRSEL